MSAALPTTQYRRRRKARQGGQEIIEFGLVAIIFAPLLLGTFVVGMNIIKTIEAKHVIRDMADMYIHGADFSSYTYQVLAQRVATGLNLQFPNLGSGNNSASNTGSAGDGIIWVSEVLWVGAQSGATCHNACTNYNTFVFKQRIVFGNSSLDSSLHTSFLGNPTGATISSNGTVSNYLTDVKAKLAAGPESNMEALWISAPSPQTALSDGQILYVVEGYFQTPTFSLGNVSSNGVYARYFF